MPAILDYYLYKLLGLYSEKKSKEAAFLTATQTLSVTK